VKEGSGDAGGDRDEFGLAEEDLHVFCARHFGQVDGASVADEGGHLFGGRNGGHVGEQCSRVNEGFGGSGCKLFEGAGAFNLEVADACTTKAGEVGSGACALAEIVGEAADIRARRNVSVEARAVMVE